MNEELHSGRELTDVGSVRAFRRISWGAIWAGMFVTVVMQIMFTLLGVACGISSLNPAWQSGSVQGLTIGAAIWLMVTWLISMWAGACVAGRSSGGPQSADGVIHGVVAWGFSTAVILLSLSTIVGTLLSGTGELLGGTATPGTMAMQMASPEGSGMGGGALPSVSGRGGENQLATQLAAIAQTDPQLAAALHRMEMNGGATQGSGARKEALNLLQDRHQVSQSEANAMVRAWNQQYAGSTATTQQGFASNRSSAARSVWGTSLWAFIALVLGLGVAAWGGSMGVTWTPRVRVIGRPV